jgi:hypothetical protein
MYEILIKIKKKIFFLNLQILIAKVTKKHGAGDANTLKVTC